MAKGKPGVPDTHCENSGKTSSFGSSFPYIHNVNSHTIWQNKKSSTIINSNNISSKPIKYYCTHMSNILER